jgi:hypothetical protein
LNSKINSINAKDAKVRKGREGNLINKAGHACRTPRIITNIFTELFSFFMLFLVLLCEPSRTLASFAFKIFWG